MRKSLGVRKHYITEIVKLGLWYVWRLRRHSNVGFEKAIVQYVDIYRLTSLYDGKNYPGKGYVDPVWNGVVSRLKRLYLKYKGCKTTLDLEEEGLAILWPYLEGRLKKDTKILSKDDPRPYGCFSYKIQPNGVWLHFANNVAPRSPFDDMPALAKSLRNLLADVKKKYPQITQVHMESWLNSFPLFLGLFPLSWKGSAKRVKVDHFLSWWGQFIDRTGDFHAENGAVLRTTGRFPYPCLHCRCGLDELKGT